MLRFYKGFIYIPRFGRFYMQGAPRSIDLTAAVGLLAVGTDTVGFAAAGSACSAASFVQLVDSTASYTFATAGTYTLCIKSATATYDITGATLTVKDCAGFCDATRAVNTTDGICDLTAGTCRKCQAHFTGPMCDSCAVGYTGANCNSCDAAKQFACLDLINRQLCCLPCGFRVLRLLLQWSRRQDPDAIAMP